MLEKISKIKGLQHKLLTQVHLMLILAYQKNKIKVD